MSLQVGATGFPTAALGAVTMEIIAPSSGALLLKWLQVQNITAAAAQLYLRRTLTRGVTPTLIVPGTYPAGKTPNSRFAVAWGTPPVANSGVVYWVVNFAATIGATLEMDFTRGYRTLNNQPGLLIPAGESVSIYSQLATGTVNVVYSAEEL